MQVSNNHPAPLGSSTTPLGSTAARPAPTGRLGPNPQVGLQKTGEKLAPLLAFARQLGCGPSFAFQSVSGVVGGIQTSAGNVQSLNQEIAKTQANLDEVDAVIDMLRNKLDEAPLEPRFSPDGRSVEMGRTIKLNDVERARVQAALRDYCPSKDSSIAETGEIADSVIDGWWQEGGLTNALWKLQGDVQHLKGELTAEQSRVNRHENALSVALGG